MKTIITLVVLSTMVACSKRDNVVVPPVEVTIRNCMQHLDALDADQHAECRRFWNTTDDWKVPACKPGAPIC
jgi:hypothetical protein